MFCMEYFWLRKGNKISLRKRDVWRSRTLKDSQKDVQEHPKIVKIIQKQSNNETFVQECFIITLKNEYTHFKAFFLKNFYLKVS